MIKIIVVDLDDTLLRNDKTISDYTVSVLKRCQAIGIKIAYATARSLQAASTQIKRFVPDIFIGYDGALAMEGTKVIHRFEIPADMADRLIKECLNTPEVATIYAINESVALSNGPNSETSHYQYTDFSGGHNFGYLKISVAACDSNAVKKIAAGFPMCDMLRYSGEDNYRFTNREAAKWKAVEAVAKHFHYNADAFVAFGDDHNDLEMIRKCGVGVAMGNAIDEVKAVADYVCDTNENDGLAKWLEEHLLETV